MSPSGEVLAAPRAGLPRAWLPEEDALRLGWHEVLAGLGAAGPRWMARSRAEADPAYKQPIPYVLVQDRGGRLAAYRRAGTERRLHGHWSIGIGGHIEPCDAEPDLAATVLACARRELAEELGGFVAPLRFLGAINEEITAVGAVHWGLVFLVRAGERPAGGAETGALRWLEPEAAAAIGLERWSRLALSLAGGTGTTPGPPAVP